MWFPFSRSKSFRFDRACLPPAAAILISLAVIGIGILLDARNTQDYRHDLRASVEDTGNMLARRMNRRIEGHFAAADYLGNLLSADGSFKSELIQRAARKYLEDRPDISLFAIASGFELQATISRENLTAEAGRGLTAGVDLARLAADLKSVGDRNRVALITGTQDGGVTLIVPVRVSEEDNAPIWGAIAVVIDAKTLLGTAGGKASPFSVPKRLTDLDWLDIAVRDVEKPDHLAFFGNDSIESEQPLTWSVPVKGGAWYLMAAPRQGWDIAPPNQAQFRMALLLAALAIIAPVIMVSSLIAQRNGNIAELKARETKLLELSQRFNLAMEASNIGIWEVTRDGHYLFWDDRAAGLHGKASSADNRMADWMQSIVPEDRAVAEAHFFICTCTKLANSEIYRVAVEGGCRYLRSAGAHFEGADGKVRTTGIVWDVTADVTMTQTMRDAKEHTEIKNAELELALDELSHREHELEELSTKLDLALDSYGCGIWEVDLGTRMELWDARMCQLYGIPYVDGIIKRGQWLDLILPEDREIAIKVSAAYASGQTDEPLVLRVPQPDGTLRYIRSLGKLRTDRNGARKLVGIAFDVTEDALLTAELQSAKKEADVKNIELELTKSRIEHNALHDPLTMLANRRKLDQELDLLSRSSEGERQKFSILHLDLDRFKQINDTLGHAAGDAMLVHASRILSRSVRSNDLVARIGGDEFVIVTVGKSSAEEMAQLAQRIIGEFHQPISFEGFSCRCGVSIGIAQASGFNIDSRRILVNADIALYRAKSQGRNRYEFFTQNLQAEIINQKRTADELLAGIDQREFVTYYQPQFSARTNELTGVEALIRWNHPHHGILAPNRFLNIAEDLNVSAVLDHMVLETVLNDKLRWIAGGLVIPKVSVNVSSKRLHDDTLIEALTNLAITPGEIAFELVESIFLDEGEESPSGNVERIKALGIDIEIDDFGTGHTSIVSLLKLRPKRLKIDRQLVMPIVTSPQERSLVRSIIDIARSLGVETVAEGVETMQHAAMLRDLGCDHLQGYAFARPLPFHEFTSAAQEGWKRLAA
ncbi:EAL domain-containing protein [Neorhizobium lilium]|uniref:EAL domain-containing protein n=1 Tax=Neorhizobium lilium TaxID=2503024 RepID=A0A444LH21_9HYPH|nr:EAL domain-containing protein [Neorhizobium lilium]